MRQLMDAFHIDCNITLWDSSTYICFNTKLCYLTLHLMIKGNYLRVNKVILIFFCNLITVHIWKCFRMESRLTRSVSINCYTRASCWWLPWTHILATMLLPRLPRQLTKMALRSRRRQSSWAILQKIRWDINIEKNNKIIFKRILLSVQRVGAARRYVGTKVKKKSRVLWIKHIKQQCKWWKRQAKIKLWIRLFYSDFTLHCPLLSDPWIAMDKTWKK